MPKIIVFCADGTWNAPGQETSPGCAIASNVLKLFESLPGAVPLSASEKEMEITFSDGGEVKQMAKYIFGVGADDNALARMIGGALGVGLVARLVRGYTYISRNYCPGDKIFLVGFSRGAYTVRALAGLIAAKGLMNWSAMGLEEGTPQSYAAGMQAWADYRRTAGPATSGFLARLASAVVDIQGVISSTANTPALQFVTGVSIEAIGAWDTVGALGIPDYCAKSQVCADVFQFANTVLSTAVKKGFHAIAVDEQRVNFTPTLWDARDGVKQVLFPGAHADVGGGYPAENNESGLSDFSLTWIYNELVGAGLIPGQLVVVAPDPAGVAHHPWLDAPFDVLPQAARHIPPNLILSQSIVARVNSGPVVVQKGPNAPYHPMNLINSYFKPDWSGPFDGIVVEPL